VVQKTLTYLKKKRPLWVLLFLSFKKDSIMRGRLSTALIPLLRRGGVIAGAYLVSQGLPQQTVYEFITAGTAVVIVLLDVLFSKKET
jgi:hypothetical protein